MKRLQGNLELSVGVSIGIYQGIAFKDIVNTFRCGDFVRTRVYGYEFE